MDLKSSNISHKPMRAKLSISIERELLDWVDKQAETLEFRSRSHVIEVAIAKLRESREKDE